MSRLVWRGQGKRTNSTWRDAGSAGLVGGFVAYPVLCTTGKVSILVIRRLARLLLSGFLFLSPSPRKLSGRQIAQATAWTFFIVPASLHFQAYLRFVH